MTDEKCPECGSENFIVVCVADHCPDCGYYFYYQGANPASMYAPERYEDENVTNE